jgi:hypothetical protein
MDMAFVLVMPVDGSVCPTNRRGRVIQHEHVWYPHWCEWAAVGSEVEVLFTTTSGVHGLSLSLHSAGANYIHFWNQGRIGCYALYIAAMTAPELLSSWSRDNYEVT